MTQRRCGLFQIRAAGLADLTSCLGRMWRLALGVIAKALGDVKAITNGLVSKRSLLQVEGASDQPESGPRIHSQSKRMKMSQCTKSRASGYDHKQTMDVNSEEQEKPKEQPICRTSTCAVLARFQHQSSRPTWSENMVTNTRQSAWSNGSRWPLRRL